MYQSSRPNVLWFTWNSMHRYSWKGLIKTHAHFWSDWWYNSSKSHFGSTSSSGSRYSIHRSSRLCAVLLITGVSALMLLMMSLLNVNVFRYVLRHVMYCDLCIKIQITSWGILIVTPLYLTLTGPPLVCTQLILSLCSANDRLRYFVTTSPIGWVQA